MRRYALAIVPAAILAAGVAGCTGSTNLLPADDASALDSALSRVSEAALAGECARATEALAEAREAFGALPSGVDRRLRARIAEGLRRLGETVPAQCLEAGGTTTTTPTTSTTTTTTEPTEPTTTTTTEPTEPTTTTTTTSPTTTTTTGPAPDPGGVAPDQPATTGGTP